MKVLASVAGFFVVLYVVAAALLYSLQRQFIYYPTPVVGHEYKETSIDAGNGVTLNLIVANEGFSEAVIYFGGNGESAALSIRDLEIELADKTVYVADYRGYGASTGTPSEKNLFADAELIYDAVSADHTTVSVIGRSLGSGVACWLATQRSVDKMVLITPYDSILSIARSSFPIFPVRWLLKDQFRSIEYAALIDIPVMAILAQRDRVIPAANSRRLINAFAGQVEVVELANTDHNDLHQHGDFYPLIRAFL